MASRNKRYIVYILRTSGGTLYTGYTTDIERRLRQHRQKKGGGSKYLRYFASCTVVYTERYATRSRAMRREYELKHIARKDKLALIRASSAPAVT